MSNLPRVLRALVLVPLASACPAEKYEAIPDTTRVAAEAPRVPRDTAAVFAPVADADVRMLLALINASEISSGAVGARKAIVADVRSFAADMVADHTAMQQATGADTAAGPGTTPAGRARADTLRRISRRQSDSLAALPRGAAFDRAYIDQQLSGHSMALDSLQRWATRVRSGAVRAMIQAALPKVQSHFDRARVIQATLGGVIHPAHRVGRDTAAAPPARSDSADRR